MNNSSNEDTASIPVLAAVVCRGQELLICQRPGHKRHGLLWEFPGGKLEPGEDMAAAAVRELAEELAMTVTSVGQTLFTSRDPNSKYVVTFVRVLADGEPRLLEHKAFKWASIAELLQTDLAPTDRAFAQYISQNQALLALDSKSSHRA